MSKDKKKTMTIDVENVDNFDLIKVIEQCIKVLSYTARLMNTWNCNKVWPTNLAYECIEEVLQELNFSIDKTKDKKPRSLLDI